MDKGLYVRGKTFWMRYTVIGKQILESCRTRDLKEAKDQLAKRTVQIAENKIQEVLDIKRESKMLFREFAQVYFNRHVKPNNRGWKNVRGYLSLFNKVWGDRLLTSISRADVDEYRVRRMGGVSKSTINREVACLKIMFNLAIEWGNATYNPCIGVKMYQENPETRWLTKSEIGSLLSQCPFKLRQMIVVYLYTGMRRQELINLRWNDLDFDNGLILIRRTKSGKPRYLPMAPTVKTILLQRRVRKEHAMRVFPGPRGRNYDFRRVFAKACEAAGLHGVKIHTLRHTFCSHSVMQGTDLMTLKELLGHSSLRMVERYSHLSDRHKRDAVARLEDTINTSLIQSVKSKRDQELTKFVTPSKN